ncbi:N-glycosylase/DNA lyase [Wickerhamomyces ciferrii]|uniref:N-glycosylase/DNA lyase n=1 Tax=Wickerhamomyces ciferrii (strain ATCC 14091 / BCRC 22168 / CBS 111 / JCM 3599 / NBRC 0793 / NRRL Y-1031 F-60-10) TaxID=1206466 RepID=K0KT85_WICCF|nr:N-glycosylase/DNA lyase [Wickerhamomyces ciferrii]CCH46366.1 N-glycosylase/DNA lyase [Wickerhamomyces ciferrii]
MTQLNWSITKVSAKELSLAKNINNVWSCSIGKNVLFLKQTGDDLHYASYPESTKTFELIKDYFNLDIKVLDLYDKWSISDKNFNKNAIGFEGVRMLRQDPWENLISFICSSNNNIKRISQMCDNLCLHFGDFIINHEGIDYYSFPSPSILSQEGTEEKLRNLSFGYRAKYIYKTALMVHESKQDLFKLRSLPYEEAHSELIKFTGVGPKVADCVCLMSLDKHDAIPVDTHVYQIAKRDYKLKSKGDTVTKQTYEIVRKFFINIWGPYAGWAQSVLFAADLKDLNNGLNQISETNGSSIVKIEEKIIKKETPIKDEEEITNIKPELEIEYSITGRPKRRKTIKVEN